MNQMNEQKTRMVKKEEVRRAWIELDASGKTLGRFCSEVAKILRGKHKPSFTPHIDTGDGVIVTNAEKIRVTGNKKAQKVYQYYTGHVGGQREIPFETMQARKPDYVIFHAVKGMMPKSRLGKQQMRKLRIFKGENHPYAAQKPIKADI